MIKNITGKIQEIKLLKESPTYSLFLVKVDDTDLTTFDKGISNYSLEDEVDVEYEESEKYKTIKSIKKKSENTNQLVKDMINKYSPYKKEVEEKVMDLINNNIFSSEFKLGDKTYEIIIKLK